MMMKISRRLVIGAMLAVASIPATAAMAFAEPLRIRVGWSNMPHHLIPVLYTKPEILKHYGTRYVVETVQFRGSSAQIPALAAKQVDITVSAASAFSLAIVNGNVDMRVLADVIQDGVEGYNSDAFLVKLDSGIDSIKDLKGKRIATNGIGSFTDTVQRVMYKKHGLEDGRDYTMIEATFPNMSAMIESGKVDLVPTINPFRDQMLATGNYKVLYTQGDVLGPTNGTFLAGRAEFLKENREVLLDFFEDHIRAIRWFRDPANREEAVTILSEFMQQPKENLSYVFTKEDFYRDPFMFPNVPNIQKLIDVPRELGLSKIELQLDPDYVDISFVEEAKRRIEANP